MDVGCSPRGFGALTMTLKHHSGSAVPKFPKIHPCPAQAQQCKGGPLCLFTAYQGAKTLCIHMIWMWDEVHGGLEPQSCYYNITRAQPYPNYPKIHPRPAQA